MTSFVATGDLISFLIDSGLIGAEADPRKAAPQTQADKIARLEAGYPFFARDNPFSPGDYAVLRDDLPLSENRYNKDTRNVLIIRVVKCLEEPIYLPRDADCPNLVLGAFNVYDMKALLPSPRGIIRIFVDSLHFKPFDIASPNKAPAAEAANAPETEPAV